MVIHFADGRFDAGIPEFAWTYAFRINAGLVERTVRIGRAIDSEASNLRITLQTEGTLANRTVVAAVTLGVKSAGASVGRADVHADAVRARLVTGAVRVGVTSGELAFYVRISVVSRSARAHWLVVDDSAFGVGTAIARIGAYSPHASLVGGTIRVRRAFSDLQDVRRRFARSATAADIPTGAHAYQCSHRFGRFHLTLSGLLAGIDGGTWIFTSCVQAGQRRRTVGIYSTFRTRLRTTFHVRVSEESEGTSAQRQMVTNGALGSGGARIIVQTRVDALSVDARSVGRAVVVAAASHYVAAIFWISSVSAQAATFRSVSVHVALRVQSARIVHEARIDAVSVNASLSGLAFRVGAASDGAACDVGISFKAFLARTDGSVVLNKALRVLTAVTRISAQAIDAGLVGRAVVVRRATGRHRYDN